MAAAACCVFFAFPAKGQGEDAPFPDQGPILLDAVYGYQNMAKSGRFLPVKVSLKNQEEEAFSGTLEVLTMESDYTLYSYEYPLELEPGQEQEKSLSISLGGQIDQMYLKVLDEEGREAASKRLKLEVEEDNPQLFIGVLSDSMDRLGYLNNVGISYSIGSYSLVDYLQAKVYFNADSTQYMKQLEALNTSRITLNELLSNDDVTAYLNIHDTLIDVNSSLQYEELWRATLATNSQLLLADNNSAVVQAEYKKIMSRDYPYVRLNLGYGYTQNRYELAATRKRDNWGLSAGVTLGFNIFDGKRRMQRDNARLDIEYANLERENLKLSLKASLNNYWQAYKNNLQILMKERENHEAAVANYELSNLRWSEGQLSGFELREAQNSLLESEESILAAEYDTKMCEVSLMLLAGRVMEYLAGN